jgi:hypothetical protein
MGRRTGDERNKIMRISMPSPAGTNFAQLFIDRPGAGAAYDEKLPDDAAAALREFLKDKLTPEDLAKFCELAGVDSGQAADEDDGNPEPLPENAASKFGQDSLPKMLQRMRTNAARIRVSY